MAALDIILKRRNPTDTGWEEVVVPVSKLSGLQFNALREPIAGGLPAMQATAATITTAGAGTYSAANLLTGLILRDPNGAGRTDTTDTWANIITAFNAVNLLSNDYDTAYVVVKNTADAAETITLAGGTGAVLQGTITIAQNSATRLMLLRLSATAGIIMQA